MSRDAKRAEEAQERVDGFHEQCSTIDHKGRGAIPHSGKIATTDITAAVTHTLVDVYRHIAMQDDTTLKVNFHFDYENADVCSLLSRQSWDGEPLMARPTRTRRGISRHQRVLRHARSPLWRVTLVPFLTPSAHSSGRVARNPMPAISSTTTMFVAAEVPPPDTGLPPILPHYVQKHGYAPPDEFQDAVMACVDPETCHEEYPRLILENGPRSLTEFVESQPKEIDGIWYAR